MLLGLCIRIIPAFGTNVLQHRKQKLDVKTWQECEAELRGDVDGEPVICSRFTGLIL